MRDIINNLSIIVLLLLCVGCDQGTKMIARNSLSGSGAKTYFHDIFRFQYTENQGAFLGLGSHLPEVFRFSFLAVLMALIMVAAFIAFLRKKSNFTIIQAVSILFIFGGGSSNVLDRFLHSGGVIDFMNAGIGNLRTGIFNMADMFILFGALVFTITILSKKDKNP